MDKMTYTVQEAAKAIGVSQAKMYVMARENKVPNIKMGKRVVIPIKAFQAWIENVMTEGAK